MMDQALSITVLEDKVPPRITLNVGLSLMEDASAPITADLLSAMDAEMDPMELVFMVRMLSVNVAYRFDKFVQDLTKCEILVSQNRLKKKYLKLHCLVIKIKRMSFFHHPERTKFHNTIMTQRTGPDV